MTKPLKIAILTILIMVVGVHASGQSLACPETVERSCGAREIARGEDFERVLRVGRQLLGDRTQSNVDIVLIDSSVVNAWTVNLNQAQEFVCIPVGLVRWQQDSDGELAFIIGHELGHVWDQSCKSVAGRARLAARSHSIGTILFGPSPGNEVSDQRNCESRADDIGLQLLVRAGYKGEDAINAFQRLQHLQRDRRRGVLGRLAAIGNDHPITSDRINHLRKLIARESEFDSR